ncbi:hypothetical protein GCG54_00006489 [Colletotrichum gloeosporioides]|uniref:Uncharacterized protein n=1 Tax=Colletotrichum gloeosporioides TaxID=474922 RepID=A0A8H4FNC8_COLGL|nr:uncharacterized protein GCG54_00006489 [Colletotrichum gloeosporioides]KAF3808623.1 hypothetical protein GCG54_00006489 [Colletotrichum gloeosporioides]
MKWSRLSAKNTRSRFFPFSTYQTISFCASLTSSTFTTYSSYDGPTKSFAASPNDLLPLNERYRFWTVLGYTRPDHYVCEDCCRLHRFGIRHRYFGPVAQPRNSGRPYQLPSCNPAKTTSANIDTHAYRHADIQIALKCHMRGLFDNQLYKRAMETRRDRFQPDYLPLGNLWAVKESVPKIVRGRFLVARELKNNAIIRRTLNFRPICPHEHGYGEHIRSRLLPRQARLVSFASLQLPAPITPPPPMPTSNTAADFKRAVVSAESHPGCEFVGSCDRCPIDFAVAVKGGKTCVRVWCDYGSYGTPMDLSWRVHVSCQTNDDTRGPTLSHEPGSVRRMFERGC